MGIEKMLGKPVVEERFIYKGYPCVVLFTRMAFRNGYVGLPKTSMFYGKNYGDIPVCCHGGLTYGKKYLYGQDDKDTWWVGFDCGHFGDGFDLEKANEYFEYNEEVKGLLFSLRKLHSIENNEYEFRTLGYVKENCKQIVDQIIELEK